MTKPNIHAVSPDPEEPDEGQQDNYDPYDPESSKVGRSPDYGVEKLLTAVPIRKPGPREFFRSHPDPAYRRDVELFERKASRDSEFYLVHKRVEHLFLGELSAVRLITTINKHGTLFLCPLRIYDEGNTRFERLFSTAMQAVQKSETCWTRRVYNSDLGGYEVTFAKGDLGEPTWPEQSFRELYRIAFDHNRLIDSDQHPVVKELRGEV